MGKVRYKLLNTVAEIPPPPVGTLQEYIGSGGNIAMYFGLKKINPAYTGNCIRVKRSTDGATTNIGFVGENLNEAALVSFAQGADLFVMNIYDQYSSTADSLYQPYEGLQFKIVKNGIIIKKNGFPCLTADGNGECWMSSSFSPIIDNDAFSISTIVQSSENRDIITAGDGSGQTIANLKYTSTLDFQVKYKGGSVINSVSSTEKSGALSSIVARRGTNNSLNVMLNEGADYEQLDSANTTIDLFPMFFIGKRSSLPAVEYFSELIVFDTKVSDTTAYKVSIHRMNAYNIPYNAISTVSEFNFFDNGINVKQSSGLLDRLETKELLQFDYSDENGISVDYENRRYKERSIELECFSICSGLTDYLVKFTELNNFLSKKGKFWLVVEHEEIEGTPLLYNVISIGAIEHDKKWRSEQFVCEYSLQFIETRPVKWVFKKNSAGVAQIKFDTVDAILIEDLFGNATVFEGDDQTFEKTITASEFFVMSGNIDGVKLNSTNTSQLWKILS
ncbi:hypothetical protein QM480_06445 [Flectobacillus sp. DC10W]|uniref:Phage tail protein n=1 Tax=Flectobacillus longus TaxID=2984207 RepID=A0ABT6YK50_9BACT|nr:hypothetical protein [Flectobacillus longus]MDI9863954.1 hypothetical protein [Flectobacillus longus]